MLLFSLLTLGVGLPALPGETVVPPAGTMLINRATLSFSSPSSGYPVTLQSNPVQVCVAPLEGLVLLPNHAVERMAGMSVTFPHRLTNIGNIASSYQLLLENQSGDAFDFLRLCLIHDLNGNGRIDDGEPQLTSASRLTLQPDEATDVIVSAVIPPSVATGQQAGLLLSATTQLQGLTASNTDSVRVASGAIIQVTKTASNLTPAPGSTVTFTLQARNTGNASAEPLTVQVDGQDVTLVTLTDIIPVNTSFQVLVTYAGTPLYHRIGTPDQCYTTTPPAELSQVDRIGCGVAQLAPGQQVPLCFTVRIHPSASGNIPNTAMLDYSDPLSHGHETVPSNTVRLTLPALSPSIHYYTNDAFATIAQVTTLGRPLFVQVDAASRNTDPLRVETLQVTITSTLTGDVETYTAVESAPNSGYFRIIPCPPTLDGASHPVEHGNGIMETRVDDALIARIVGANGATAVTTILVDPYGVVFDSRTNAPVAGAQVTLFDVVANRPAVVFAVDGVTPAPNPVVTGADGIYRFPLVAAGTYQLRIVPPGQYRFPSAVPVALLPADRHLDDAASYGRSFSIAVELGAIRIDVPIDAPPPAGLFIEKTAARTVVEYGDFVDYQIKGKNTTEVGLTSVVLTDELPFGFRYQRGTARLNGQPLPDPAGALGPRLRFALGTLVVNAEFTLTYRVQVGPGAVRGDNTNRAQLAGDTAFGPIASNITSAVVQVRDGVLTDKGIIIGTVFVDRNGNRTLERGEPGIPGVRVTLEDGTYAITDGAGQYTLYGVSPRTHVLKLDRLSLPTGAVFPPIDPRQAGNGTSYFVDMKRGELFKANFAEHSGSEAVLAEVMQRIKDATTAPEIETVVNTPLASEATAPSTDVRALPASGTIGPGSAPAYAPLPQVPLTSGNSSVPPLPVRTAPSVPLDQLLATLTPELGFIDLKDGDILPIAQANIRVKGTLGAQFALTVNGEPVSAKLVGQKSTLEATQAQAWEYIGVALHAGSNTLLLTQTDSFGNARGSVTITVKAPGTLARVQLYPPAEGIPADGRTVVPIEIRLVDGEDVPVTARTPVTLEAACGQWVETDLNPDEPGVQRFIEGGVAVVHLRAPVEPVDGLVRVTSGLLEGRVMLAFVPSLRPLLAAGLLEGTFARRHTKSDSPAPRVWNLFDDDFHDFDKVAPGTSNRVSGQGAAYVKGAIKGDYLLTLRYDSEHLPGERLFRDIQPDEFYPLYGDASVKGFDAQSTSPLYVRVEKKNSYFLYGDYTTCQQDFASSLGTYNRSLTGGKQHIENKTMQVNLFASRDSARQVIDEIPGAGISGPYALSTAPLVENSEKVEILTRDRNQPAVILRTIPQVRFLDYEMDALNGTILFKSPVPSLDANLNPIAIRVTYEVDQGGPRYWVAGANGQWRLNSAVEVGAWWVDDDSPQNPLALRSANLTLRLAPGTTVQGEVARTDREALGAGYGRRLELRHESARLQARLFAGRTDPTFDNPAATLNGGRKESSAKATYRLNEATQVTGEAIRTADVVAGGRRTGYQAALQYHLPKTFQVEVGVRHAHETTAPAQPTSVGATPVDFTSLRAKLTAQLPNHPSASVFGEYERDIKDPDKAVLAVGGDYQFANRGRLYARHEFLSSLSGRYALNETQEQHTTVVGLDTDYMKDGRLFSEYRINDAISGREAEAAIGLRNQWTVAQGVTANTTFERVHSLTRNVSDSESTAATAALTYTRDPRWKASTQLEIRDSASTDSVLGTLGVARKLSNDWSLLGKALWITTDSDAAGNAEKVENRVLFGLAYRQPEVDRWSGLVKYEFKHLRDALAPGGDRRDLHLFSAHANYHPSARVFYTTHYALKLGEDRSNGLSTDMTAQWLSGRVVYDLGRRWDISGLAGLRWGASTAERQYGLGAELGRQLNDDLWLSVGYNHFGFHDEELVGENYSDHGFYLRLRFKFDEDALQNWAPERTRPARGVRTVTH